MFKVFIDVGTYSKKLEMLLRLLKDIYTTGIHTKKIGLPKAHTSLWIMRWTRWNPHLFQNWRSSCIFRPATYPWLPGTNQIALWRAQRIPGNATKKIMDVCYINNAFLYENKMALKMEPIPEFAPGYIRRYGGHMFQNTLPCWNLSSWVLEWQSISRTHGSWKKSMSGQGWFLWRKSTL